MAEENNNNNVNDIMTVLRKPILLLVGVVLVAIFLIVNQLIPQISEFIESRSAYNLKMEEYASKEQKLESAKDAAAAKNNANPSDAGLGETKEFYKPLESGMDTESILAAEFDEILELITANSIKTRSVKFTSDPSDDNFVKGAASKYSVCKLDMEMIASYANFRNFLKDLYRHDHYLDIAKIEIIPYQKNKSVLLINLQLKLYAEKA